MSYLIKDTTREERLEFVNKALAISLSGAKEPSQRVIDLLNEYIEGNIELKEIKKIIIKETMNNAWSLYLWKWCS